MNQPGRSSISPSPDASGAPGRRALVTGGAGFIGSHLVEHLLARGDSVVVLDDLSTGRIENLGTARRAGGDRLRMVRAKVSEGLPSLAGERFDEVYHLAAAVGVKRVIERPIESIETNVLESAALLRFASENGPSPGRGAATLVASSSEVYGKSPKCPFSEDDDCVYGPTTAFRWSYAASKALDEYLALAHHARHGLPVVVVRFFNTVGPRQVGDYGMVLPSFVRAALEGRTLQVYGTGRQTRCFCDVRDVVPALPRLLGRPECMGKVFNLGSDQPISIMQLAKLVCETLGSESGIELVPYDEAYGAGFEDLAQRVPDLERVRRAIGFRPAISLEQTIRDIASEERGAPATAVACRSASTS